MMAVRTIVPNILRTPVRSRRLPCHWKRWRQWRRVFRHSVTRLPAHSTRRFKVQPGNRLRDPLRGRSAWPIGPLLQRPLSCQTRAASGLPLRLTHASAPRWANELATSAAGPDGAACAVRHVPHGERVGRAGAAHADYTHAWSTCGRGERSLGAVWHRLCQRSLSSAHPSCWHA